VSAFPHGWPRLRAKHIYRSIDKRAGSESRPLLAVSIHHGVVPREELTEDEPRADDLSNYKRCAAGDVVLNRMRAFQGAVGVTPQAGIVSPDYVVLRLEDGVDVRFFHHLFRSSWFVGEMTARVRGIGSSGQGNVRTPRIHVEDLGEITLALPPLHEQQHIADYLNAETVRIDGLRERERELLALLQERLRTVIADAFESGGGRFRVLPVRAVADVLLGRQRSPEHEAGEHMVSYLRAANVNDAVLDLADVKTMNFTPQEQATFALRPGDVLVTEGAGSLAAVGASAVWRGELPAPICFQNTLVRLRPRDVDPDYLAWWARHAYLSGLFASVASGANIFHLGAERVRGLPIPIPPIEVQRLVAKQLAAEVDRIEALSQRLQRQMELLGERRQALITAAVTGELDIAKGAA
jgi:type I restriction enzyme S subunit